MSSTAARRSATTRASPSTLMPTIAWLAESHLQRVGDRDDLHDPGVAELLNPLAHGRLGQPDGLGDRPVGAPPVLLELLDDGLVHRVEQPVGEWGRCR